MKGFNVHVTPPAQLGRRRSLTNRADQISYHSRALLEDGNPCILVSSRTDPLKSRPESRAARERPPLRTRSSPRWRRFLCCYQRSLGRRIGAEVQEVIDRQNGLKMGTVLCESSAASGVRSSSVWECRVSGNC